MLVEAPYFNATISSVPLGSPEEIPVQEISITAIPVVESPISEEGVSPWLTNCINYGGIEDLGVVHLLTLNKNLKDETKKLPDADVKYLTEVHSRLKQKESATLVKGTSDSEASLLLKGWINPTKLTAEEILKKQVLKKEQNAEEEARIEETAKYWRRK
ncbi:MAG TPA: hypothetical protein VLG12_00225 [Candidatus Saccharimonadales bacterium]|nr:hypothetical protein [Candidatus Saccharimonadales bacterium]